MAPEHRAAGLALALTLLLFSGFYSHAAPAGVWGNKLFASNMWLENDPGGHYVASAHELVGSDQGPLFPGHPGTPLQLLLAGIQHGYFWIAGGGSDSYTSFIARHIHRVYFFSKMLVTLLQILSIYLVYRFALLLLERERAAGIAALGYASSFPVLYYLSRISVEPLLVSFFLATFLSVATSLRRHASGDVMGARMAAALAGLCAASGFFTKLNLLGPLPFFAPAYLLARSGDGSFLNRNVGERLPLALTCALASVLAALFYTQWMDWGDFFLLWRDASETQNLFQHGTLAGFLPSATPEGIFLLCEFFFVAAGGLGWVRLLKRPSRARMDGVWLSLYASWILLIWLYRVATLGNLRPFHYLLLIVVLSSVGFGLLTEELLARSAPHLGRIRRAGVLTSWILLFHHVAIWSVVDSRRRDVEQYQPIAVVHQTLADLEPGQRIALLARPEKTPVDKVAYLVHGLSTTYAPEGRRSRLRDEYHKLFTHIAPSAAGRERSIRRSKLIGSFTVIEQPRSDRMGAP